MKSTEYNVPTMQESTKYNVKRPTLCTSLLNETSTPPLDLSTARSTSSDRTLVVPSHIGITCQTHRFVHFSSVRWKIYMQQFYH